MQGKAKREKATPTFFRKKISEGSTFNMSEIRNNLTSYINFYGINVV